MDKIMFRLIRDGKIMGYESIDDGMHYQSETMEGLTTCSFENCPKRSFILWDSIELGIKFKGEWYFHGDRFRVNEHYEGDSWYKEYTGVLTYDEAEMAWWIEGDRKSCEAWDGFYNYGVECVGNIHDGD